MCIRDRFSFLQKHVTGKGQVVTASIKLDVYAPE